MTSKSTFMELWDDCNHAAMKIDDSIQETSAAFAQAVKTLTDGKVGTMPKRLEQYRIWLEEGKAALEGLEQGAYKDFCNDFEELLAADDDEEIKDAPEEEPEGDRRKRADLITQMKDTLDGDLSRIKLLIEDGLGFYREHAES
ncbi:hypothetical protein FKW77_000469 [Venturia effusa]|uniref:Uncharacterized protein n=1 Tax=Venturia effusa TaxID=50376 RepID=A0A517KVN5_9PEZI|nr:hypothetical protein FKW77_000469 [Venturia effusa]